MIKKKIRNLKYKIYSFIYLTKLYFSRFNKKIVKFRKIKKIKSPIFLFENRLKVSQFYFSSLFSGCSTIQVEYKIDDKKDDDFKLILYKLIEIFKENSSWHKVEERNYYNFSGFYKKEDREDVSCLFNILIDLINLNKYIENPCEHYSIGSFLYYYKDNIIYFKIFYGKSKLILKENDLLYHSTNKIINEYLKGFYISSDSVIYSSQRIYVGLNIAYDRYGGDMKLSDKKEIEKFMKYDKDNKIFKINPSENNIIELYLDPELDQNFNCGYIEINKIKKYSLL